MKLIIAILVTICLANAVPLPKESIDLVQIPLKNDKELDVLTLAEGDGTINERNKRTIGILRELFPQLSKIIEQKLQMIIQFFVRTLGPILLRSGGLGGGGTSTGTSSSSSDDDFDDFEDDKNEVDSSSSSDKGNVSIKLPTFAPDTEEITTSSSSLSSSSPTKVELFDSFEDDSSSPAGR